MATRGHEWKRDSIGFRAWKLSYAKTMGMKRKLQPKAWKNDIDPWANFLSLDCWNWKKVTHVLESDMLVFVKIAYQTVKHMKNLAVCVTARSAFQCFSAWFARRKSKCIKSKSNDWKTRANRSVISITNFSDSERRA